MHNSLHLHVLCTYGIVKEAEKQDLRQIERFHLRKDGVVALRVQGLSSSASKSSSIPEDGLLQSSLSPYGSR